MWMANRERGLPMEEPMAELGGVTVTEEEVGVALAGERRGVLLCAPGGYRWKPTRGDTVLVVKAGTEQAPCVTGALFSQEEALEEGEVCLSAFPGTGIALKPDGSIELKGLVIANGVILSRPPEQNE